MRTLLLIGFVTLLGACTTSQHGPWVDDAGHIAGGVNEYPSHFVCDERGVTFLDYAGKRFAADPLGLLGPLSNDAGDPLVFERIERDKDTLFSSGLTHTFAPPTGGSTTRELLVDLDADFDYIYIEVDGEYIEQWPRAEDGCPSEQRLAK